MKLEVRLSDVVAEQEVTYVVDIKDIGELKKALTDAICLGGTMGLCGYSEIGVEEEDELEEGFVGLEDLDESEFYWDMVDAELDKLKDKKEKK